MTPARPVTTWSDEELRKAWPCNTDGYPLILDTLEHTRAYLKNLGAVHPQEHAIAKREAEREAWDACALFHGFDSRIPCGQCEARRDERYPSLLSPPPPPLVLSTGTWTRKTQELDSHRMLWSEPTANLLFTHPTVVTASDAEALAAWLRAYGSTEEQK